MLRPPAVRKGRRVVMAPFLHRGNAGEEGDRLLRTLRRRCRVVVAAASEMVASFADLSRQRPSAVPACGPIERPRELTAAAKRPPSRASSSCATKGRCHHQHRHVATGQQEEFHATPPSVMLAVKQASRSRGHRPQRCNEVPTRIMASAAAHERARAQKPGSAGWVKTCTYMRTAKLNEIFQCATSACRSTGSAFGAVRLGACRCTAAPLWPRTLAMAISFTFHLFTTNQETPQKLNRA